MDTLQWVVYYSKWAQGLPYTEYLSAQYARKWLAGWIDSRIEGAGKRERRKRQQHFVLTLLARLAVVLMSLPLFILWVSLSPRPLSDNLSLAAKDRGANKFSSWKCETITVTNGSETRRVRTVLQHLQVSGRSSFTYFLKSSHRNC